MTHKINAKTVFMLEGDGNVAKNLKLGGEKQTNLVNLVMLLKPRTDAEPARSEAERGLTRMKTYSLGA